MELKRLLGIVDSISEWSGRFASWLIFPMAALIVFETLSRSIFNSPTKWAEESSQMLFGALFIIAGACALRYRDHVNMDIVYNHFPPRMKAIVDLLTSILFFLICGSLLWKGGQMALISVMRQEHSIVSVWAPPIYPLKLTMPIAAFLILLQGLAKFIRDLNIAITK